MRFRFCGDLDCPDWVLAEIATLSKLTSVRMKILVIQILGYCIAGSFNYEKVLKIAKDNADGISDLKGSIAAVHFIIANSAKHDLDEASLVQEIQQLGLPKEHSEVIARQYREHKDALRVRFSEESYRVSTLLSTDWRVDLTIASSDSTKRIASVQLKLNLDTQPHQGRLEDQPMHQVDGDRFREVAFELDTDKLDILLHELAHAQTLMENIEN